MENNQEIVIQTVDDEIINFEKSYIALKVTNDDEEANALVMVKQVKDLAKNVVEAKFDELTSGAKSYVKTITALFKPRKDKLAEMEFSIKQKMTAYAMERHKKIEAERVKAFKLQEKEIAKAEKSGKEVKEIVIPEQKNLSKTEGAKVSYRDVQRYEIFDAKKIPLNFMMPDEKKIASAVKSGIEIEGVRVWVDKIAFVGNN